VAGTERSPDRPRWHAYRWRLEPLFGAHFIALTVVLAAVLYVMTTGLLSGPSDQAGGRDAGPLIAVVFLLAAIAVMLFLVLARKRVRKRSR